MKRLIITAALILATLSGCRNENEAGLFNGTARRTVETTIIGRLNPNTTRTELADDGRLIYWSKGDSIGLFNTTFYNVGARLDDASAGSTEGVFKAGLAGKAMYAYYPYSSSAKITRTTVDLNLPAVQTQHGNKPDMRYDLKCGTYVSGSSAEGILMEFTQKLTLLDFVITPLDTIIGEKLESISFSDAGKALAGNYTLNLADVTAPLSFEDGFFDTVTLKYAEKPVFTAGETIRGWMFVNPSVKNNDHLKMVIRTNRHIVTVDINSEVQFNQGYKYRMPLDLPKLKSKGYVSIRDKADEFDVTTLENPGIYNIEKEEYTVKYEEGANQYACYSSSDKYDFRIQSLPQAYAVSIRTASALGVDIICDVVVSKTGDIDVRTGTFSAKVIKMGDGLVWMHDETNGMAYVIIK